jgi:hypothetical protein
MPCTRVQHPAAIAHCARYRPSGSDGVMSATLHGTKTRGGYRGYTKAGWFIERDGRFRGDVPATCPSGGRGLRDLAPEPQRESEGDIDHPVLRRRSGPLDARSRAGLDRAAGKVRLWLPPRYR